MATVEHSVVLPLSAVERIQDILSQLLKADCTCTQCLSGVRQSLDIIDHYVSGPDKDAFS